MLIENIHRADCFVETPDLWCPIDARYLPCPPCPEAMNCDELRAHAEEIFNSLNTDGDDWINAADDVERE
jgi:hypothetical protein